MEGRQEAVAPSELGSRLAESLSDATFRKTAQAGLDCAEANRPYFGKTIADLALPQEPAPAIVIVGGPSLHRRKTVPRIAASGFKGTLVVADGSLGTCLRNGLIPHYMVTVDGHPHRIVRWLGDTELKTRPADDYFTRQDFDPEFWKDELRTNQQLLELVDRHGPKLKAVISTSVHTSVTKRCVGSGMELYWWNPLYDDVDRPDSVTRKLYESNGIPCMTTGGNVGTAAWVFAHSVLGAKEVAVVGMDLGYAPGTPLRNTQYYYELREMLGERVQEAYTQVPNAKLGETWFTDPTYLWYRKIFIDLAAEARQNGCTTYNCTEGGTLFDEGIPFIPLDDFLKRFS